VVIVLQRIDARPKAIGKQLRMFADDVNYSAVRVFVRGPFEWHNRRRGSKKNIFPPKITSQYTIPAAKRKS